MHLVVFNNIQNHHEDLPEEWLDCQRILRPILKQALRTEKYRGKVKLKQDKLVTDGKSYGITDLKDLPKDINIMNSCQKSNDSIIAFFGPRSVYSNMHMATFSKDNQMFHSSEQFIQHRKAEPFKDDVTANKI